MLDKEGRMSSGAAFGLAAKIASPLFYLMAGGTDTLGGLASRARCSGTETSVRIADRLEESFDVVWITVKAAALESALDTIPPEVQGDGVLVPLLDGVDHVGRLREHYGAERVLPGSIRVEAEQAGPRRVRHLSAFADVYAAPNACFAKKPATRNPLSPDFT